MGFWGFGVLFTLLSIEAIVARGLTSISLCLLTSCDFVSIFLRELGDDSYDEGQRDNIFEELDCHNTKVMLECASVGTRGAP